MTPGERRRLSRQLSRLASATVAEALAMAKTVAGSQSPRVGVTGPPGAGKSSLIAKLVPHRLRGEDGPAIVAIDPRIYIRSLATRASVDGLADNLPDILSALDGDGFAELVIETVGVGQVEYAVRGVVDMLVLVLPPGAGDQVQAMKSGILEKADLRGE